MWVTHLKGKKFKLLINAGYQRFLSGAKWVSTTSFTLKLSSRSRGLFYFLPFQTLRNCLYFMATNAMFSSFKELRNTLLNLLVGILNSLKVRGNTKKLRFIHANRG